MIIKNYKNSCFNIHYLDLSPVQKRYFKIFWLFFLFLFLLQVFFLSGLGARGVKKTLKSIEEHEEYEASAAEFTFSGFAEFENFFNTYTNQNFSSANKKSELRLNLKMKYGLENIYIYSVTDLYFNPSFGDLYRDYAYEDDPVFSRNGRFSTRPFEVKFKELYVNWMHDFFRIRAGNQVYAWGTADANNPTSYFNPSDTREVFFKSGDEMARGVPSLSAMFFYGDYSFEAVFVPVHIQSLIPAMGNFWESDPETGYYSAIVGESEGLDVRPGNFSYGARMSASISGYDFSVSAFHGPEKSPLLRPWDSVADPRGPIPFLAEPEYFSVTMIGFDFTTSIDKFVFQAEAAYSPDKKGIIEITGNDLTDPDNWPWPVVESHYFSYSIGFNYFVPLDSLIESHPGNMVFTLEWTQSVYFDSRIKSPFLSDTIITRIEDSLLEDRLKPSFSLVWSVKNFGYMLMPGIDWDFQNGFTVTAAYGIIEDGRDSDSIYGYYKNNDILIFRVKYEF